MTDQRTDFAYSNARRVLTPAVAGDPDLGPLQLLPGTWANLRDPANPADGPLPGRGWNLIALPFATPPGAGFNYRVLMNQYNERLVITTKDTAVPNRGIRPNPPTGGATTETDQALVALDYEQGVVHIATDDSPSSSLTQPVGSAIHHEPGLFLFMKSQVDDGVDIARLGTIPHGDSVLALGRSTPPASGPPSIPATSALPIGVANQNPATSPYLAPYLHFIRNPFLGVVPPPFQGFRPDAVHLLLEDAIRSLGPVRQTTTLRFSTAVKTGGIVNIPFIVEQANATEMESTFWILELEELGVGGSPRVIMLYLQVVMLDFFRRTDGQDGLIKWPHVSINTLERLPGHPPLATLISEDIATPQQ
jgi:hypothetical protein